MKKIEKSYFYLENHCERFYPAIKWNLDVEYDEKNWKSDCKKFTYQYTPGSTQKNLILT